MYAETESNFPYFQSENAHSSQEKQEQSPVHCANCDIDIRWPPTVVEGVFYCCTGCAAGGPCNCDYSQYRSETISGVIYYGSHLDTDEIDAEHKTERS